MLFYRFIFVSFNVEVDLLACFLSISWLRIGGIISLSWWFRAFQGSIFIVR
jgi:hypothetical protein